MSRFHTDEYVDFLNRVSPETVQEMTGGGTRCTFPVEVTIWLGQDLNLTPDYVPVLVGEDNPAFDGLFEFCSISAGGSISKSLSSGCGWWIRCLNGFHKMPPSV